MGHIALLLSHSRRQERESNPRSGEGIRGSPPKTPGVNSCPSEESAGKGTGPAIVQLPAGCRVLRYDALSQSGPFPKFFSGQPLLLPL